MPGIYFRKCQDSFPTVYCYVPWQSQFFLDRCLAFIFINARTLFPTSTAMSPDSRSFFSMDNWRLWKKTQASIENKLRLSRYVDFHKRQDSFPNVYCYLPWQSQFVLDWCLPFFFENARTLFPTSTAMSFDSRSLFSMDAWRLSK